MAPSISLREYIRWEGEEATEPTSTIVLTSEKSTFVDIRILKPKEASTKVTGDDASLPFSRLDWAFSGTSSSKIVSDPDDPEKKISHSKWAHWVSNRSPDVDDVIDEGDMYPQPEGLRTIEKGRMVNPATGLLTAYEESWLDPEPFSTVEGERRRCVVLRLHDDANHARGVVVRIGEYCQGVVRIGNDFALERWMWDAKQGWQRLVRLGELVLPCRQALDPLKHRVGEDVQCEQSRWKVEELSSF